MDKTKVQQGKIASESGFVGQSGINLIATVVAKMRHLWTPTTSQSDIGIDGYIEICRDIENGRRIGTNFIIQVQSKATEKPWPHEDATGFVFKVDLIDLQHWLAGNHPIILIVSRPATDEAYWVSVKDYFSSLEAKKTRTIYFKKSLHRFDENTANALQSLSVPRTVGLTLDEPQKVETLHSNLFPIIRFPETVYRAKTKFRKAMSLWKKADDIGVGIGNEWFLKDRMVSGFLPLNEDPWPKLIASKTIETIDTTLLSESMSQDDRRDFVRLLNHSLTSFLGRRGLRRFKLNSQKSLYYFPPQNQSLDLRQKWGNRGSERAVIQKICAKSDPSRILCYRHCAFISSFEKLGEKWHLIVEPTYHFTTDGKNEYALRGEYLAGIKKFEKHQAVSNNMKFWAYFLTYTDMFETHKDLIGIGPALEYEIGDGIDDSSWLSQADDEEKDNLGVNVQESTADAKLDEVQLILL